MHDLSSILHYVNIAILASITSLGTSISQGLSSKATINAIYRQPKIKNDIIFTNLISLALIETAGLIGLIFAILMFLKFPNNYFQAIANSGIVLAITVPAFTSGINAHKSTVAGLISMSRQPTISKKIRNVMILMQSLMQTPIVFSIVVSILIQSKISEISNLNDALGLFSAGLCFAIGSIGPILAMTKLTTAAFHSIGLAKEIFSKIFYSFAIISITFIETPIIFATIISVFLINSANNLTFYKAIINLAAAITMGIGPIATGISSGNISSTACNQIAKTPENSKQISITSWIGQGIIETAIIYVFVISIILILGE